MTKSLSCVFTPAGALSLGLILLVGVAAADEEELVEGELVADEVELVSEEVAVELEEVGLSDLLFIMSPRPRSSTRPLASTILSLPAPV